MTGVVVFGIVFVGFFILRGIAATITFYYILPESAQCPMCNEETVRVQSKWWNRLMPWFRTSWCYRCGWEGLLRSPAGVATSTSIHTGQLPLSSKKSS
jgi:hypothetical protein